MIAQLEDEVIPIVVFEKSIEFDDVDVLQSPVDLDLGDELQRVQVRMGRLGGKANDAAK